VKKYTNSDMKYFEDLQSKIVFLSFSNKIQKSSIVMILVVGYLLIKSNYLDYSKIIAEQIKSINYSYLLFADNLMRSPNYMKTILLFTPFLNSAVKRLKLNILII
jgi:hypothetical protein